MKILAVINALGEGGTEKSFAELIPHLEERGVEVHLATLRTRGAEGVEPSLRDRGVDIRLLEGRTKRVLDYRELLKSLQPDVVHSMLFEANMLARVGGVGGPPVLTSLVNTSYARERRDAPGNFSPRKLEMVRLADAITGKLLVTHFHAVSEAVKEDAVTHLHLPARAITVIRRGREDPTLSTDPNARAKIRAELGIPDDALVIVNVGRHEFQKDHRTLIEALAPLFDAHEKLWLVVAGRKGSETPAIEAALQGLSGRDRVRLLGHRGDVPAVLAASDIFVLSSRYEGLPGALLEAMAMSLPAVATDIGPVREVAEPDKSALLATLGSPESFRSALRRLIEEPELRTELGERGRKVFEQRFRMDESADALSDLYIDVADRIVPTPLFRRI